MADEQPRNHGKLILDATVAEQAIRYPTDLGLLNEARELSERKGARYTYGRGPFRLVHQELHINRAEASKREIIIKAMTRTRKLALIQGKRY